MKKILVIGWDSADWGIIRPLADAGMMPGIQSLMQQGVSGTLKTLEPSFSPMLWTSIATGKHADKHNILGFLEPNATGDGIRPISGASRKVKAAWNILQSVGYKCNVIGWWPSHPAEPVNGVMVSNLFHHAEGSSRENWQMPGGAVWPASLTEQVKGMRVHPSEVPAGKVQVFVPQAASVNQEEDNRLQIIQSLVAGSESVFNTALWTLQNTDWDFTAMYFNELDKFSHHFMKFHPPQLEGVPDDLYRTYNNVITAAYTYYDVMLQVILKTIPSDTTVILVSDHGFYSGEKRPARLPAFNGAVAAEHNPFGILCVKGPGIREGEIIYGAGLLDITPTILSVAGLPTGEDMDGEALTEIFAVQQGKTFIPTWEEPEGVTPATNTFMDTFGEAEALQRLIDLGYIERLSGDMEEQINMVIRDRKYNLSGVYASTGRVEEAIELLEALYEEDMVDLRYNFDLIRYHLHTNNTTRAREVLTNFRKFDITYIPNFDYLEGKVLYAEDKKKEALEQFLIAREKSPRFIALLLDTAETSFELDNTARAIATFKEILALDPNLTEAHLGLAKVKNRMGKYEEATEHALDVLQRDASEPFAHYQIGMALFHLEEYEAAAQALEVCLRFNPNISRARNMLLNIYRKYVKDVEKYEAHYKIFLDTRKGEVIVVSGLPRSGTSMMMQMLQAGGVEILSDGKVQSDWNNPKGYFEYEPVKRSRSDNSWMVQADGKAVKVISQLLPYLQLKYRLKVIFMERNLDEVIVSQQAMLASLKKTPITYDLRLKDIYSQHIKNAKEWAEKNHNVQFMCVNYKEVLEHPEKAAMEVNKFLGSFLDESKMAAAVDEDLYRIKSDMKQ